MNRELPPYDQGLSSEEYWRQEKERRELLRAIEQPHRLRDMRSVGIGLQVWALEWALDFTWARDGVSATYWVSIGPVVFMLELNALTGVFGTTAAELLARRAREEDDHVGI